LGRSSSPSLLRFLDNRLPARLLMGVVEIFSSDREE
jgi:hypothetical protein